MIISQVTPEQHEGWIPLHGWEALEFALRFYASGASSNAAALYEQSYRSGFTTSQLNQAVPYVQNTGKAGKIIEDIIQTAKKTLRTPRGYYHRNFEYEGMGTPFFKMTVSIAYLNWWSHWYRLRLYQTDAHGGPEDALAKALGAERGLYWTKLTIIPRYIQGETIDAGAEQILRRLDSLPDLGTQRLKGHMLDFYGRTKTVLYKSRQWGIYLTVIIKEGKPNFVISGSVHGSLPLFGFQRQQEVQRFQVMQSYLQK